MIRVKHGEVYENGEKVPLTDKHNNEVRIGSRVSFEGKNYNIMDIVMAKGKGERTIEYVLDTTDTFHVRPTELNVVSVQYLGGGTKTLIEGGGDCFVTGITGEVVFLQELMVDGVICEVLSGTICVKYGNKEINVVFVNGGYSG